MTAVVEGSPPEPQARRSRGGLVAEEGTIPGTTPPPATRISVSSRLSGPRDPETVDRRRRTASRYTAREVTRRLLLGFGLGDARARRCGWRLGDSRVFSQSGDGRCRSVGVEQCQAGRICPVCGPRLAAVRAAQVGAGVWRWMTANDTRSAVFVSIAASHKATDVLEDVHAQLLDARAAVMRSDHRQWKAVRARYGIANVAWVIEHNIGPNGPHVGLHLIFLTDRWWTADDAQGAETWFVLRFREELARLGFTGRLSCVDGIDVRPVDDPAGIGRYLTKWGIGRELVGQADKLGRNGVNVPYASIPGVLALEVGRRDPHHVAKFNREVRALVDAWGDYARLAIDDSRNWYRGFHRLKELVPELAGANTPAEIIAAATEILPEELRPERADEAESDEEDDTPARLLEVDGDAWQAAQFAWWRGACLDWRWIRRARSWHDGQDRLVLPLELVVVWLGEDEGLASAALMLADLSGGNVSETELGWSVTITETVTQTT